MTESSNFNGAIQLAADSIINHMRARGSEQVKNEFKTQVESRGKEVRDWVTSAIDIEAIGQTRPTGEILDECVESVFVKLEERLRTL